jgi:serine/threonine-protein kinase
MTDAPPTKSKAPPRDRFIGTRVGGKYRIDAKIAKGGMGSIYKATQEPLGRTVVVKILSQDHGKIGGRKVDEKRFFREASIASRLAHPNTVVIHDYGSLDEDGGFYLVMEHLDGPNLAEVLEAGGPLSAERALHMLRQVASSLMEAHDAGVIHRDLKPGNLIIVARGGDPDFVKVVDFGLVKPVDEEVDEAATEQGVVIGSPLYMSPEQIFAGELDQRTDIYSLGCVAFEMLTGRPPFIRDQDGAKKGIGDIIRGHASQPPPPLRSVCPSVTASEALEAAIRRCLAKQMEHRFDSMRDLLAALNEAPEFATSGPALITSERRASETVEFSHPETRESQERRAAPGGFAEAAPMDPEMLAETGALTGSGLALAQGAGAVTGSSTSERLATTGPRRVARVSLTSDDDDGDGDDDDEAPGGLLAGAGEASQGRPDSTKPMSSEMALELARDPVAAAPTRASATSLWIGLAALVAVATGVTMLLTASGQDGGGAAPPKPAAATATAQGPPAPATPAPAPASAPDAAASAATGGEATPAAAQVARAAAPDPDDALVMIRIESEPAGAEVVHGDAPLGRTPTTTTVRRGDLPRTWTLTLPGYAPYELVQAHTQMSNLRLRPVLTATAPPPAGPGAKVGTGAASAPATPRAGETPQPAAPAGDKKKKRKKKASAGATIKMTR